MWKMLRGCLHRQDGGLTRSFPLTVILILRFMPLTEDNVGGVRVEHREVAGSSREEPDNGALKSLHRSFTHQFEDVIRKDDDWPVSNEVRGRDSR